MCGRLSQYTGLHEFVDALSMPNALVNLIGAQAERYNVAPSTAVTTLRLEGDALVAQPIRWGWRPFWARDRAAIGQFPGLDDEPADHHGFVIITADAEGGMVDIHDRRPVVLSPELAREWLDPATPPERAEQIVRHQGEPSESFTWYPVSREVGNVRNQGAHLIEPQRSAS